MIHSRRKISGSHVLLVGAILCHHTCQGFFTFLATSSARVKNVLALIWSSVAVISLLCNIRGSEIPLTPPTGITACHPKQWADGFETNEVLLSPGYETVKFHWGGSGDAKVALVSYKELKMPTPCTSCSASPIESGLLGSPKYWWPTLASNSAFVKAVPPQWVSW